MAKKDLEFEATKNKFIDDEDGEATLILRISMRDKLSAFAVPAKRRLQIKVRILPNG